MSDRGTIGIKVTGFLVAFLWLAVPAASGEVVAKGPIQVSFDGRLTPHALPRHRSVPVRAAVDLKVGSRRGAPLQQLRSISIEINRHGRFNPQAVPSCALRDIQPATTEAAVAACGGSIVGHGSFAARILLGQQSPFPSSGKIVAFNGRIRGRPAIFAHIYGTEPVPTSYTVPFVIGTAKGLFGTVLRASLPASTGASGHVTRLSLDLGRSVRSARGPRSYITASCPAPDGFATAPFTFARASFGFGTRVLSSTLQRTCRARG